MTWRNLAVDGALLVTPEAYRDERGLFCAIDGFRGLPGMEAGPARACTTVSSRGVLRGMHVRPLPGEAKLVCCVAGRAFDVIADLRPGSPTRGAVASVILDSATQESVLVPAGCAHGYQALEENTVVTYLINREHNPAEDVAIAWDDPSLGIDWPLVPVLSGRDRIAGRIRYTNGQ